jgi:hypothetical protein
MSPTPKPVMAVKAAIHAFLSTPDKSSFFLNTRQVAGME